MSLKERGNQFFRTGRYQDAVQCYQLYIDEDASADKKTAYANISFCHFKLQQYRESIEAADNSIEEDSTYGKAYYRKMHAYKELGTYPYDVYINAHLLLKHSPDMDQKNRFDTQLILKQYKAKWIAQLSKDTTPNDLSLFQAAQATSDNELDGWLQKWQQDSSLQSKWEEIEDVIVRDQPFGFNLAFLFLNQLKQPHYDHIYNKIRDTQNTLSTKMDVESMQEEQAAEQMKDEEEEEQVRQESSSSSDQNLFESTHSPLPLPINKGTLKDQSASMGQQLSSMNQETQGLKLSQSFPLQSFKANLEAVQSILNEVVGSPNSLPSQKEEQSEHTPPETNGNDQKVQQLYQKFTAKLSDSRDVMTALLKVVEEILASGEPVKTKRRLLDVLKERRQKDIKLMKSGFSKEEQAQVKELLVSNGMQSYLVDFANKHVILK